MTKIYTAAEFRKACGKHFRSSPGSLPFDENDVPASVAALIPYARYWGLTDPVEVRELLNIIPVPLQRNFRDAVLSMEDAMDEWLAGPEAESEEPTDAYVAFSAMRIAAYSIFLEE